ncbi:MAG: sodium-dependent transporter, partial [Ruminococcus sp.]
YATVFISGGGSAAAADGYFGEFIGSPISPLLFTAIFIFLTAAVVMLGVQKGIEKISKILMPVLLILTVGISIYSLTLDGAMKGLIYYIKPNFSAFSLKTVIAAMGQLFYSMSLAMGIMITYGSYMQKKDNLESSVRSIEIFDTAIAFLSGLMIIPAVFAFSGGDESALNQGPGLMFVTLPKVFDTMAGGNIVGIVFFILVFFAALTSSISLMETIVSIFMDKFNIKRSIICIIVMIASMLIAVPSSLGNGVWSHILILGKDFLSFFDFLSNNIMMPVTAFLTCIFVGYVIKTKAIEDEVELSEKFKAKKMYQVMVRYICPVFLLVILISSVIGYV